VQIAWPPGGTWQNATLPLNAPRRIVARSGDRLGQGNGKWKLGIGIVLFAQNVAPTIEVVVIAAGSTPIN